MRRREVGMDRAISDAASRRPGPADDDTTELVLALRAGDRGALDRLMPRVYDELRLIAHRELARRGGRGTLCTTGLLHEVYLKLVNQARVDVEGRSHFFALAATAMRHVLIDYARERATKKRGGEWRRISLDGEVPAGEDRFDELIELDDALERLKGFDDRLCSVVECRFFGGMTVPETATALGLSPRSVDRAWQKAKAWLYREMHEA